MKIIFFIFVFLVMLCGVCFGADVNEDFYNAMMGFAGVMCGGILMIGILWAFLC